MVTRPAVLLTVLGSLAAWGILSATTFAQDLYEGRDRSERPSGRLSVSEFRNLVLNPLYSRYRPSHQVQTGINPMLQQQTLLQQQALLEQQRAAEKAQKRDADRARKLATTKARRAKELELREEQRQKNLAARAAASAEE